MNPNPTNNLEDKIAEIIKKYSADILFEYHNRGKYKSIDRKYAKQLANLFTSYANEVANKAAEEELKLILPPEYADVSMKNGSCIVCGFSAHKLQMHLEERLDQLRTKTGED